VWLPTADRPAPLDPFGPGARLGGKARPLTNICPACASACATSRPRTGSRLYRRGMTEVIGAVVVLECDDIDEAARLAATWPLGAGMSALEVRPGMSRE
jgi:hypothetical protein